MLKTRLQKRR
jgi:hypothetical protein